MIFSSFWYRSGILGFLYVKFIADFRTMVMACSGCQFGLCRWFTYWTIFLPTMFRLHTLTADFWLGCEFIGGCSEFVDFHFRSGFGCGSVVWLSMGQDL